MQRLISFTLWAGIMPRKVRRTDCRRASNTSARPSFPKAKAAASRALEIDETLADAPAARAYATWYYDWDWNTAEREFKRALELNPNSAISHLRYGECLTMRRRFDEGIAEGRKALELDPLSLQITNMLAYEYISARRYDEAIASGQKSVELEPNVPIYHGSIALPYALKGQFELARKEFEKIKDQIDR
jgi:tetratricopeptide (TPR) repeat protein